MIRWIIGLVLIFGLQVALAQETETVDTDTADPVAEPVAEFITYTSTQFGFSIEVPASGLLRTPDDQSWNMDPEIAMVWEGSKDDPVSLVELRVDRIGDVITPGQFDQFYTSLVEHWEVDPAKYTINRSNEPPYRFGQMDWSIIEVTDSSHESGERVFYTIFAAYNGDSIYTIGFYYLTPVSKAVQDMAVPMMKSFAIVN